MIKWLSSSVHRFVVDGAVMLCVFVFWPLEGATLSALFVAPFAINEHVL